jgi:hypothetical protein
MKLLPIFHSLVLITFAAGPVAADIIDDSLRMRFNFDSAPVNNVIVDTSPSATHPGTNIGAIWNATENGRNGVMDFKVSPADRITIPAIPALNSTKGTISFWIKTPGNLVRGSDAAMLVDRRTDQGGDVITLSDAGTIFVQARSGWDNANSFSGVTRIDDNQWHHVAYVYDQTVSGLIEIYVDGTLDNAQVNGMAWAWPANQPLEVGSSHDSWWRVFVGLMDDFQIHNRMLTQAEIAATFAANPVLDSSLVERLNFTAAPVDNVVVDSSSSGNSATNTGAVWVAADGTHNGIMSFELAFTLITVAPDPDLSATSGTIAFWMKSTGNTGPGDYASIIFDRRAGGSGDVIAMRDDGTIFVQAHGGGPSFSTQASVKDGNWHHVAYVYDQSAAGFIRVYIDGTSSGFGNNTAEWSWPANQQLELGLSHDGYWYAFEGALDEIRYYNRALTAAEVSEIGVAPSLRFDFQPASQTVFVGDDITLAASANMQATYQWRLYSTNLPNSTNTTLVLADVQSTSAGPYTVTASNASFGMITSTPAILTVNPRPSLSASLVARYNFDAAPVNNVVVDSSPAAKHPGTNVLATWVGSVGTRSGVMQFAAPAPGSQIVIAPHPDFDSSKGAITFWLKTPGNDLTSGDYAAIIFDRRTWDGDVITLVDDGTLFVQARKTEFTANSFATTTTVNDDAWHHIAYVYDQGQYGYIRFYVDGQLAGSNPNSIPWAWDPAQQLELGKSHDTYWRRLSGYLDDVQFYGRTLTAPEVVQSMTLVTAGPALTFTQAGNQLTISWGQPGFVLQQNSDLQNTAGWTDVGSTSPATITLPATGYKFYRLRNQ